MQSAVMHTLVWLRVPGDIVFALGVVYLGAFALKLLRRRQAAVATAKVQAAKG